MEAHSSKQAGEHGLRTRKCSGNTSVICYKEQDDPICSEILQATRAELLMKPLHPQLSLTKTGRDSLFTFSHNF